MGSPERTAVAPSASRVARWSGSSWQPLGSGLNGTVLALASFDGQLVAAGEFTAAGGASAAYVARWTGSAWQPSGEGLNASATALAVHDGALIAAGSFTTAGGVPARGIARWDGAQWSALGGGLEGRPVNDIVAYGSELVAAGFFDRADGRVSLYFAHWTSSGIPWFLEHPADQSSGPGATVELAASLAPGYGETYEWRRAGISVINGRCGVVRGGGDVSGADGPRLVITEVQHVDAGVFECLVATPCGTVVSRPASVSVTPPACRTDFNNDGGVNSQDFFDFLTAFFTGC